ncbi:phage capsid protein [uncultured Draconibacterium sp.]|uniref:phage capsid protein n=1 Tax=uncultured Draconibacterium sp. TaxID=1573823 RepID=UPI0032606A62
MAEINPIKYSSELQKQLFPDNSFYKKALQETGIADTTERVERPVQGSLKKAKSGVPKTLPLQVDIARDDSDYYSTDLVYAPPIVVDLPGEFALNYNKRAAKQVQQAGTINTRVATIAAINWGPTVAAQVLKTSGSSRASNVVAATGSAINNRKAVTKADMIKVHNLLMRMNLSGIQGNFYGLVTPDFYSDLLGIAEFVDYDKTGNTSKLEAGIIGRLMGIELMVRSTDDASTGLLYSSAYAKKVIDADVVATDCPAALFWHDKMVASAEGISRTSVNADKAEYLGATVLSSWTRFGAATARADQKGVVALLEENA